MIDVWSSKVVAWDVTEREDPFLEADLVSRACLRKRYCCAEGIAKIKGRQQPLILHAHNGKAMKTVTLECRLEEQGALRSFSRQRNSHNSPHQESLLRTARYTLNYPRRPLRSVEPNAWVAAFLDWHNYRHRHSGIRFVTPVQRHNASAITVYQQRFEVYENARRANPARSSLHTRCWRQPVEAWINKQPEDVNTALALSIIQAD